MKYDNSSDRKKKRGNLRDTTIVDIWWLSLADREYKVFFLQRRINDRWVRDYEQAWTFWNYCSRLFKKKRKNNVLINRAKIPFSIDVIFFYNAWPECLQLWNLKNS